jgi:excinuclease ABC subunit B
VEFRLESLFTPTGDQPQAIEKLTRGILSGARHQVLLGVTGSGKTFTIANVIERIQKPTLVITHNKTLAAQLYQEFRDFFPQNAISYFVSYYDYYQPESYIPETDTYIEKETEINEEIEKLRLAATTNLLTRKDVIIVASVSAIYNLGSPVEYGKSILKVRAGDEKSRQEILERLTDLQYERNDYGMNRSGFRAKGDTIEIYPSYDDIGIKILLLENKIDKIQKVNPLTGNVIDEPESIVIYPAKHYMTDRQTYGDVLREIERDCQSWVYELKKAGKLLEAQRIRQRVSYDLEMIQEVGYVNGIENYSRYFDGRKPGGSPYTLLDYFPQDFIVVIDESHMTIPQISGMYHGDKSRKETLIKYGFRLPSALDNRPLKFDEFLRRVPQAIYVSATPSLWEISRGGQEARRLGEKGNGIVEQLIRPTGLLDPQISIRPTRGQIDDLIHEIENRVKKKERVLVTTLTKRMAEELANYLEERNIHVHYLHSDIETLKRVDILRALREGKYDVVVGINLLREGLDLPEVSLVAILDADKEGFLRSKISLIQTMGRAARHTESQVILYADFVTRSMKEAISEVTRRRKIQEKYNSKHHITPKGIVKPIRKDISEKEGTGKEYALGIKGDVPFESLSQIDLDALTPEDRRSLEKLVERRMRESAKILDFETAAYLRDYLVILRKPS